MESCSGTRRKLAPRCIVNHSTSRRSAIDAYEGEALELRTASMSAPNRSSDLEKHRRRNIKSLAQFLDVGFIQVTFLMQDFRYDAFRAKDWNKIFLAQIIRIHQRAEDFDRRSIRNGMMLFFVCFD